MKNVLRILILIIVGVTSLTVFSLTRKTEYNQIVEICTKDMTEEQLRVTLLTVYEENDLEKPWKGDFEEHMSNRNGTLVFK